MLAVQLCASCVVRACSIAGPNCTAMPSMCRCTASSACRHATPAWLQCASGRRTHATSREHTPVPLWGVCCGCLASSVQPGHMIRIHIVKMMIAACDRARRPGSSRSRSSWAAAWCSSRRGRPPTAAATTPSDEAPMPASLERRVLPRLRPNSEPSQLQDDEAVLLQQH